MSTTDLTLTAITGGIGSGKSVVSRILRVLEYPVYDCDSRAKALMDADVIIKQQIIHDIDRETIAADGTIDRRRLASIVFADAEKLAALNAIVHSAVRLDIQRWAEDCGNSHAFVETAILFQSGLNYMSGCEEVEKQIPQSAERDELVKFIRESKRGIIKPYEAKAKEE